VREAGCRVSSLRSRTTYSELARRIDQNHFSPPSSNCPSPKRIVSRAAAQQVRLVLRLDGQLDQGENSCRRQNSPFLVFSTSMLEIKPAASAGRWLFCSDIPLCSSLPACDAGAVIVDVREMRVGIGHLLVVAGTNRPHRSSHNASILRSAPHRPGAFFEKKSTTALYSPSETNAFHEVLSVSVVHPSTGLGRTGGVFRILENLSVHC